MSVLYRLVGPVLRGLDPETAHNLTLRALELGLAGKASNRSRVSLQVSVAGLTFPSPYNIAQNGLIYLPPDMPQPSDPSHTDAMLAAVTPLLDLTSGGMFCLFTSHRALNIAKKWFKNHKTRGGM